MTTPDARKGGEDSQRTSTTPQPTVTSTQYQLEVGEIEAQLLTRVEAVKGGSGIDLPFPRPDRSLKKLRARLKDAGEEYLLLHRRPVHPQVQ